MTTHTRTETHESVGGYSGQRFYRATCRCGWRGLDENDPGLASESFKRHQRQQAAKEAA